MAHLARSVVEDLLTTADTCPLATAVIDADGSHTYADIAKLVRCLAGRLAGAGVARGARVGVRLDRSMRLSVALFATLRAGAVFVPVDPHHPAARQHEILKDAEVSLVLTDGLPGDDDLLAGLDVPGLRLPEVLAEPCGEWAPAWPAAEEAAYLIYTSGSTGRPKGVLVSHGSLANLARSMLVEPGLGTDPVMVAVTTPSFDMAIPELVLPLLYGGTQVFADWSATRDPALLAGLLDRHAATVLQATPTTWRLLLDHGWKPPAGFRMWCGADSLTAELAKRLCATGARAWDLYGPTEATVWCSSSRLVDGVATDWRPVDGCDVRVLDDELREVSAGQVGEVWVGGTGLALGYWRRPALTAERFVPSPFSVGGRLYRTGDVARRNENGVLEILGRDDHQVKIRGHRVELGEIESTLERHPAVAQAVVLARSSGPDTELVGFLVPAGTPSTEAAPATRPTTEEPASRPSAAPLLAQLAGWLRERLPSYEVPGAWAWLPRLPTTVNGKVDRKQLSTLPATRTSDERADTAADDPPRDSLERTVAAVWVELLGVAHLGRNQNLLDVGANSLLVARAANRLRVALDRDVSVDVLFENPTVRSSAHAIAQLGASVEPVLRPRSVRS